jgi:ParB family chromosome partitioning protein
MSSKKKTGLGNDPFSWIAPKEEEKKEETPVEDKAKDKSQTTEEVKAESIPPGPKQSQIVDGKEIRVVPISAVTPDPHQPRKGVDASSEDIKELAESIKKHGFINFITVKADKAGGYIVVAGERRFTAAKVAGFSEIPVMVIAEDKAPEDYALLQIEENMQRKELTPFEEADAYIRLQQEFGLQQKEIVQRTQKSKGYISRMMKLSGIAQELRTVIQVAPREILFELASFPDEQQKLIWQKIKENPSIVAFEKARKKLEAQQEKKKEEPEETERPDPDAVFDSLKRAMKKDKNMLFEFITPKKVDRLMSEFGKTE